MSNCNEFRNCGCGDIKLEIKCKHCGYITTVSIKDIEDVVYSDVHDPDVDYFKCTNYDCNRIENIVEEPKTIKLIKNHEEYEAQLLSDTCDLFITYNGTKDRIADIIIGGVTFDIG